MLYKYRPLNHNTLRSLIDHTLFFSDPIEFNDPFDSKLFYGKLESKKDIHKIIDKALKMGLTSQSNHKRLIEMINDPKVATDDFIEQYLARTAKTHFAKLKLCCFSEVWDNIQMWGHYADCHKGICLGFETIVYPNDKTMLGIHTIEELDKKYPIQNDNKIIPIIKVNYRVGPIEPIDPTSDDDTHKKFKQFVAKKKRRKLGL